ncbi:hypothetical protein QNI19_26590 [Cytophagaceae bacterium DM2B3-1]|uniref:Uncharacterized protein n=1 Tax=Xanthocytophaga flava TaxID=3048013 RepID=A0AAE3QPG4_9BACT|nr:hypothetical protein [Xanthocytophaga flavus]MDJ1471719.1 hypothetical protein [Xanthocytophaga flavus]MDJ1483057.1 hypothetical protein [Xanthocytophaga flavus]MDJ1496532.1 hypothetical protein [Xanthocytophaga flavus]
MIGNRSGSLLEKVVGIVLLLIGISRLAFLLYSYTGYTLAQLSFLNQAKGFIVHLIHIIAGVLLYKERKTGYWQAVVIIFYMILNVLGWIFIMLVKKWFAIPVLIVYIFLISVLLLPSIRRKYAFTVSGIAICFGISFLFTISNLIVSFIQKL